MNFLNLGSITGSQTCIIFRTRNELPQQRRYSKFISKHRPAWFDSRTNDSFEPVSFSESIQRAKTIQDASVVQFPNEWISLSRFFLVNQNQCGSWIVYEWMNEWINLFYFIFFLFNLFLKVSEIYTPPPPPTDIEVSKVCSVQILSELISVMQQENCVAPVLLSQR